MLLGNKNSMDLLFEHAEVGLIKTLIQGKLGSKDNDKKLKEISASIKYILYLKNN